MATPRPPYDDAGRRPQTRGARSMDDIYPTLPPETTASQSMSPTAGQALDSRYGKWMPDRELLSIVQRELDSSLGWTGTRLAEARRARLNEYFANLRGDERVGRSQVVTRDTFEQVEWALPGLMDIFTSSKETAQFDPVPTGSSAEDMQMADDQAAEATAGVNYVFEQNDGFMCLYTMFKDALIQKNGIAKVFWDDSQVANVEEYQGKHWVELVELSQDENYQFREVTAMAPDGTEVDIEPLVEAQDIQSLLELEYDIVGVRVNTTGHVCYENVPPEEFIINRDARGENHPTCRFIGQRVRTSESQLIAWGFSPELVSRLPGSQSVYTTDQDAIVRASQDDSHPLVYSYRQDSERTIYVQEVYVLADRDGDGISEWWKVVAGGDYGEVLLDAKAVDGHPFVSVTPIPIPHRFYGLGIADITADLQNIDTSLWRQYLDGLYLANDPRNVVLSRGMGEAATPLVNLDQLVTSTPGGYIEEYEKGALRPYVQENNAAQVIPGLEMHQSMVERRTGINPDAMGGADSNAISKHVYGAMVQSSGQQKRMTLYARIFAETGVKALFQKTYEVLLKHQIEPLMVKLRGKWTPVSPAEWKNKMRCQVSVGLGHGSAFEKAHGLASIGEVQKTLVSHGLTNIVDQDNVYHLASDLSEAWGFKNSERYFNDPASRPPPQPKESPEEKAIEAQQAVEIMRLELDRQKLELERFKALVDAKDKAEDNEITAAKEGVEIPDEADLLGASGADALSRDWGGGEAPEAPTPAPMPPPPGMPPTGPF